MKCPKCGYEWTVEAYAAGGRKSRRKLSKREATRIAKLRWARCKKCGGPIVAH